MEWLRELAVGYIEEEKLNEFIEGFQKEFPKHAMPKAKFNEVNEELKITKQQLADTEKSMETLKEKASSVEEYEAKVKEWEEHYNELKEQSTLEIGKINKRANLKELLILNNANKDAIDLLTDKYIDTVELAEDGTIREPSVLLEKIKTEKAGLFDTVTQESRSKDEGKQSNPDIESQKQERLRKTLGLK